MYFGLLSIGLYSIFSVGVFLNCSSLEKSKFFYSFFPDICRLRKKIKMSEELS